MSDNSENSKLIKLLDGLEVPDIKLTERCSGLIKDFHLKYDKEVEEEEKETEIEEVYENPYKVDKDLLEENERKLKQLLRENKRIKKEVAQCVVSTNLDPERPWRTHSHKEKLLRINNELKRHYEKAAEVVLPLTEDKIKELVKGCQEESCGAPQVTCERLRDTVDAARKNLPNFQYRKIENTTATAILPEAHVMDQTKTSDLNVCFHHDSL